MSINLQINHALLDKMEFMKFALDFAEDMGRSFLDSTVSRENRVRCKQIMFPAGILVDEKNKVYTPEVSIFYRGEAKKKSTEVLENSHLVRVKPARPLAGDSPKSFVPNFSACLSSGGCPATPRFRPCEMPLAFLTLSLYEAES